MNNSLNKHRKNFKLDLHYFSKKYDQLIEMIPLDRKALSTCMNELNIVTDKYLQQNLLKEYKEDIDEYERRKNYI